ncbi:MAG: ABC transporter permease [Comamonadaceae bacterium]|jgi:phospholipid/cholesterol/gamma-HCH transport system permease protein|uniref:MlaE family ABC transporter permease n=1 Tax=Candidatus Skiveiella danica TaxID=3386177 RepID=UPI001B683DAB|nr:ABC transporter permease [Comamonadaceae bacterium]MBK9199132.1 ABC transporter permease [Betaproteobacteria bacterium]MBP6308385.1 ABC transporter permease [Burkholderiaceae bacterium]MBK6558882.1 ABC transporter permease [Comamonadaceae bacterium]MBK6928019.1 ABC transporter permease [Comamonadaceae bacterium]
MEETVPRIARESAPQGPVARTLGRWTAAQLTMPGVWSAVEASLAALKAEPGIRWDLRDLQRLDHLGAQALWNHWGHQWPAQLEVLPDQRAMLERVARFAVVPPPYRRRTLWEYFLGLGELLFKLTDHLQDLLRLIGQLMLDLMRLVRAPRDGPWRDVTGHIFHIGATALPITALVGFLIGVVLAYLTSQQLRLFGAEIYIVNILGLSLIRELGPVLAAVLIAGRSGSAITAQIGVMRVTEELDAMRVMGIPQGFRLVMPRAMAMALAMPLITLWTTIAALVGGMLAADIVLGITPSYFINNLPRAVMVSNLWLAMGKSVVFGLLIALIGCHYGLRVKPNTESLGQGTTASVVTSITVVILIDALFAVIFKNIGI